MYSFSYTVTMNCMRDTYVYVHIHLYIYINVFDTFTYLLKVFFYPVEQIPVLWFHQIIIIIIIYKLNK